MLPVNSKWLLCWASVCGLELFAIVAANCSNHDVINASPKKLADLKLSTNSIEDNDVSEERVNSVAIKLLKGSGLKNDESKGRRWVLVQPETITKAEEGETTQHLVTRTPLSGNLIRRGRGDEFTADDDEIPQARTYRLGRDVVPAELQKVIEEARNSDSPVRREGALESNGQPIIYKYESSGQRTPPPQAYEWQSSEQQVPPKTYEWQSSQQQVPPKTYEWQSSQQQVPPKTYEWQSSQQQVPPMTYERQSSQQQVPPQSYEYEYSQKAPLPSQKITAETGRPLAWVGKATTTTSKSPRKEEAASYSASSDDDDDDDDDELDPSEKEAFFGKSSAGSSSSGAKSSKSRKSTGSSSKSWTTKSGVISGSSAAPVHQLMAIKRVRVTKYHKGSKAASKALAGSSARAKRLGSKSKAASFSRSRSGSASSRGFKSVSRSGGSSTGKRSPRTSPRSSPRSSPRKLRKK